jgi:hypothetical protein
LKAAFTLCPKKRKIRVHIGARAGATIARALSRVMQRQFGNCRCIANGKIFGFLEDFWVLARELMAVI